MSGIYFHTLAQPQPVVVRGGERARIDGWIRDTFRSVLRRSHMAPLRYALGLDGAAPVEGFDHDKVQIMNMMLDYDNLEIVEAGGAQRLSVRGVIANTVVAAHPASQALVWLHYGCEAHGWVEGPDRMWLADRYQEALDARLAHDGVGWEAVIGLLRDDSTAPVVTSFYNDFPNLDLVEQSGMWTNASQQEEGEEADRAREHRWAAFSETQRWELGMRALRAEPCDNGELQWSPTVFATQGIAHNRHAEELVASGAQLHHARSAHVLPSIG